MTAEKHKNEIRGEDAPQTGPMPEEDQKARMAEAPMPEIDDDGRDPSRAPANVGRQIPNLMPNDEQRAVEKEVLEGVDRAESDQRRVAQSPSERPPEAGDLRDEI